jgi:hypothetical protein
MNTIASIEISEEVRGKITVEQDADGYFFAVDQIPDAERWSTETETREAIERAYRGSSWDLQWH